MNTLALNHSLRQQGAALLISLVILLIMTVLGVSAMNMTTMEEKMAANNQQRQQAFQAAESALRNAESWLTANITSLDDLSSFNGGNAGLYSLERTQPGATPAPPTFDIYTGSAWTTGNSVLAQSLLPNQNPRYIIEYMGKFEAGGAPLDPTAAVVPARHAFRITAIGSSVDGTARYLAWSHFARRLN